MWILQGVSNGKTWYKLTIVETREDKNTKQKFEVSRSTIFISEKIKIALVSSGVKIYENVFKEVV